MSQMQSHLVAACIGATVGFISAASIILYQKLSENKKQGMKNIRIDEVNQRLIDLQQELEILRTQQNQQRKKKRLNRKHIPNDSTYTVTDDTDVDAFSTANTDIGDDEFFDCSDSENDVTDIENWAAETTYVGLDCSIFDVHSDQEGYEESDFLELQNLMNIHIDNIDVVWRYARSCYKYSNCITDPDIKKKTIVDGIHACEKFLYLSNADLYKWCAILIGLKGDFLPLAEKIQNGYVFKEYIIKGLEIHPDDSTLHHLLGRFRYEVASLSWLERKLASTLFAEPPSASYEDAIESFQSAEKYATEVDLENRLFLSKCYLAINDYKQAFYWLDNIRALSVTNKNDQKIQDEAIELLSKYSKYRT